MEKVIQWLLRSKSIDPMIRFGRLALVFFSVAAAGVAYSGGNLPRLIFLTIFMLGFAIAIWGAAEIMKSKEPALVLFGRVLAGAMLVSIGLLFLMTISFLMTGTPTAIGRILGSDIRPKLEEVVKELESPSLEMRLLAISHLEKSDLENEGETDNIVRILEAFINRRAAIDDKRKDPGNRQTRDIEKAVGTLGMVLKFANNKSFKIRPLEFGAINLASVDLSQSYFRGASFSSTIFDDAILDGSDFSNALLVDIRLSRVHARNILLRSTRIQEACAEESNFDGADFSDADVSSSDFNGASFKNANLSGASFVNTRFSQTYFDGANLTRTNLSTGMELDARQLKAAKAADFAMLPEPLFVKSRLTICKQM